MQKQKLLSFKLKKNLWWDIFWAYKSLFHWSWLEFTEHKEYTPWDEIKNIDWKLLWKTDKLFIKKFEELRNLNVLFILDIDESFYQFKNKLELLEEVFYTLALSAAHNNDNIYIYNKFWWEKNKLQLINRTIEDLENKNIQNQNLENEIEKIAKNPKIANYLIFILTDKDKITNKKAWKLLGLKNELIFINIFDYFENNLENINLDINFKNQNKIESISLSDKTKIEKYKKLREKKLEELKNNLKKSNIDYLYLDTNHNPYKEIFKFFERRN